VVEEYRIDVHDHKQDQDRIWNPKVCLILFSGAIEKEAEWLRRVINFIEIEYWN
jgi:hypothetical protein